ncbi:MAG TPA: cytochrome c oxidase assembly protein [Mycobacteriales bacterium]
MNQLPPLDLGTLVTQSQARVVPLAAAGLAAAGYLVAARRPGKSWPRHRTAAFLAGLAVLLVATCSGIEAYGRVLQWVHMIEHLLLIMVAPVLLAVGSPVQLLRDRLPARAGARLDAVLDRPVVGWLLSPVAAALAYAVAVVGVHLTGLLARAMTGPVVHGTEELVYLAAGFLLFQLTFGVRPGPWQLTPPGRLALLVFVTPVDTVVGFVLLQTGTVQANLAHAAHDAGPRPDWALSPATDTAAAGTTMWIGGTGIMALLLMIVGLTWLHGRAPARDRPGWADRARAETLAAHTGGSADADADSDDALRAYNDYLARLAESERRGRG